MELAEINDRKTKIVVEAEPIILIVCIEHDVIRGSFCLKDGVF